MYLSKYQLLENPAPVNFLLEPAAVLSKTMHVWQKKRTMMGLNYEIKALPAQKSS